MNLIRGYVRAEIAARAEMEGAPPSISRTVFTDVWEPPRLHFHRQETQGLVGIDLRNKVLLVPWSVEAADQMKRNVNVTGLILEHVTPVHALWKKLKDIHHEAEAIAEDSECESDGDAYWDEKAIDYLRVNFVLSVLISE